MAHGSLPVCLSNEELKNYLRQNNCKLSGKKADLIERVRENRKQPSHQTLRNALTTVYQSASERIAR